MSQGLLDEQEQHDTKPIPNLLKKFHLYAYHGSAGATEKWVLAPSVHPSNRHSADQYTLIECSI